jgi:hypothetical protein
MINWTKLLGSTEGSIEARIEIPNPVEEEYPIELRLTIFNLKSTDFREPKPKKGEQFRAHARMGQELFRLFGDDIEDVKHRVEDGLRQIFGALLDAVVPNLHPGDWMLLEAAVRFPAFNERPRRGAPAVIWMVLDHMHHGAANRLVQAGLCEVQVIDGARQMSVTPAGKRELARRKLIKLDANGYVVED